MVWRCEEKENEGKWRGWRRGGTADDLRVVGVWGCTAASQPVDVSVEKSSRMNAEVSSVMLSAHIHTPASEPTGWSFTLQVDNDLTWISKETRDFFKPEKGNVLSAPNLSHDLNPTELRFTHWRNNWSGKNPENKQEVKTVAVKTWKKPSVWWCVWTQDFRQWLQRMCNQRLTF